MANAEFKKLNIINRAEIIPTISEYLQTYYSTNITKVTSNFETFGNVERLFFTIGDEKNNLDFYFLKTGLTTISPGNHPVKLEISEYIKNKLVHSESKNSTITVKNISLSCFEDFLETARTLSSVNTIEEQMTTDQRKIYTFIGSNQDKLTVTYFSNGTILVQGRPLLIFTEINFTISQLLLDEKSTIVATYNSAYELDITHDEVSVKLKQIMPDAYNKLDPKLEKELYQAVYMTFIEGKMYDYAVIAYPAFRAIEGQIKTVISKENIIVPLKEGKRRIGNMFYHQGHHKLRREIKETIPNIKIHTHLEKMYNKYCGIRNVYFHWEDVNSLAEIDNTQLIEKPELAKQHVVDILGEINYYYKSAN